MDFLRQQLRATPIRARALPYVILVVLTVLQDSPGAFRFWMYFAKMLVGAWCVWAVRDLVTEARWAFSWEALFTGVLVFLIWVGLDPYYPKMEIFFKSSAPWNPFTQFREGSLLGIFFVAVRGVGSAVVVPPIEEAFYRSFLYRYFVRTNFTEMPFARLHWLSLIVTSAIFGLAHYEWLAGFLCGLSYQALTIRKNRLGDAMTAHGVTNLLLAIYIPLRNAWHFW